ncbi:MAG TPA: cell wall-binding repeat-containing protein [Candidatus Sulfotelmatobacter sp.]|nr:cell wall-binding repeat-containing protein [Candidatus Sulfotelmatobacter sp.]
MRRHPLAAGSAVLAVVLLAAVLTQPPALTSSASSPDMVVAPASTAASCTGWTSTYVPPVTIRVGMVTSGSVSSVVTVPFVDYVQTVLAAEWGTNRDATYLQIGALAVKQYGWYYAIHGRLNHTFMDQCFDVRSDTVDQLYDPAHHTASAEDVAAVTATWQISMRKAGVFFLPHYNGTTSTACGAGGFSTGTLLPQQAVQTCITQGMDRNAILHLYFDPPTPPLSIDDLINLAGGDRYATAVAISAWRFQPGVPVVILASGANFPDALSGGPAAAKLGGPILLLPPTDTIPDGVATELQRLAPQQLLVLGGSGAVSDAQFAALAAFAPGQDGSKVSRLSGPTRYDTAIAVSQFAFPTQPGPPEVPPAVPVVFIANGSTFPDAMAGASAGARLGGPVLMEDPLKPFADQTALQAELVRLKPATIRILGGPAVVPDTYLTDLAPYAPDVARIAGADRYATAAALAAAYYQPGEPYLFMASGLDFPDGLAGAALGGPIVFLPHVAPVPFAVLYEIGQLAAHQLTLLGGGGAVGDSAVAAAGYAFEIPPTPSPSPSPTPSPSPSPTPSPTPAPTAPAP